MLNWNLDVLYKNDQLWLEDLKKLPPLIDELAEFKGKLHQFENFKELYKKERELEELLNPLFMYMRLKGDLNLKDVENQSKLQQLMFILNGLSTKTAFIAPEIISLGKDKVMSFIDMDESLEEHRFPLEKLFHQQKHVLDDKSERLLANFAPVSSIPNQLHQALSIVDAVNLEVALSDGRVETVTPSNYRSLLQGAKTAEDRALIFEAVFDRYRKNKTSYAHVYNLILQNKKANYTSRGFKSSLEASLFGNNIPTSVFHNLKDVLYDNTDIVKRYVNLRKKHLGLKEYRTYDRFLTLKEDNAKYTYEESKRLFFESIKHLDSEYVAKQKDAIADGFVDVLPKDGKRTGAYSSGIYGHHPYILLNHDETLDSVFTLVHEAGHSAHTLFSNEAQEPAVARYQIFVAEIASTFNEHLLLDYLLKEAKTKDEKIVLLEKAIDGIMGTFVRQTLFATYEFIVSEMVENGTPINEPVLSKVMIDLYKHYYDLDITKENGKELVWAYIPHFFGSPFYVYQYASSYSASLKIYEDVKSGVDGAMENYIKMLKMGGSAYPVDEAIVAGANLLTKEPFEAVIRHLTNLVDELEKALE